MVVAKKDLDTAWYIQYVISPASHWIITLFKPMKIHLIVSQLERDDAIILLLKKNILISYELAS